jgi:hypothetical protein
MPMTDTDRREAEPAWYVSAGDQPTDKEDILRRSGTTPEQLDQILTNERRQHREEAKRRRR